MDKSDLSVLLADASAEEVDQIHRLLHLWSVGPENSFPVQLALLTRAQWQMAATVPRSLNDSRKWLELHLAEYRRQMAASVKDLADTIDNKNNDLKNIAETHAKAAGQAVAALHTRLGEVDEFARAIRRSLETAQAEFEKAKASLNEERQKLEQVCREMDHRLELRGVLWVSLGLIGAFGIGIWICWISLH
jgi:DNA repair exonuclease SbcCD ATPase subunit